MPKTNWRKLVNPDYLGAYSLDDGNGHYKDLVVTIDKIKQESVTGAEGKRETCPIAYFKGPGIKPMVLNSTNMKTLQKLFHSKYIEDWEGGTIQLYVKSVKAFGDIVDALRIRPTIPKPSVQKSEKVPVCADCGKEIVSINNHSAAYLAAYTQKHYGKPLCAECAERRANQAKQTEVSDPLAGEKDGGLL